MNLWRSNEVEEEKEEEGPATAFLKGNHFDIEAYASNYRGRMKIVRLIFIADRHGSRNAWREAMQLKALRIAYERAKKGKAVDLLGIIVRKIRGRLGPNYGKDEHWWHWVNEERHVMSKMGETLAKNCESRYARGMMCAEEARSILNRIGHLHEVRGAAWKACWFYKKSLRLCRESESESLSESLSRMIVLGIQLGDFEVVAKIAQNRMQIHNLNPIAIQTLRCALGLALFKARRYKDAAHQFLGITKQLGNRFSEVMAPHDIAAFGALCALATFQPPQFKTLVVDNQNFQFYLDSAIEVKELIRDFYSGCYCSSFRRLDKLRQWLLVDIYFFNHFETLYDEIRNKALILYTQPYVAVGLPRLAVVFGTTIEAVQKVLAALINTNQIQADIDSINKVVCFHKVETNNATSQQVWQSHWSIIERDQVQFFEGILYSP